MSQDTTITEDNAVTGDSAVTEDSAVTGDTGFHYSHMLHSYIHYAFEEPKGGSYVVLGTS